MQQTYQPHPLAALVPEMTQIEYERHKADIQANGQLLPISVYQNMIIDGRHRFRACKDLGLIPRFEEWTGKDAKQYVISMNVSRRQLSDNQRALAAAAMTTSSRGRNKHTATAAPS